MADRIITVTNPSVVTNDTLLGYNNYSDIDGQLGTTMTPTEATNGHTVVLSDGVTHQVTTKPVGTVNGEFTGVVSNSVEVVLTAEWTLLGASYDSVFGDVAALSGARGVFVKDDGTRAYVNDNSSNIQEYTLSTPYDISSIGAATPHNILTSSVSGLYITSNGSNVIHCNTSTTTVYADPLGTPWDLSTDGVTTGKNVTLVPIGAYMTDDGNSIFFLETLKTVRRWDLGTPYDMGTATDASNQFDVSTQLTGNAKGLFFSQSGKKMFAEDATAIYEYDLDTAWDLTTSVYSGNSLTISGQDGNCIGFCISSDGAKLYTSGNTNKDIYQYSMG